MRWLLLFMGITVPCFGASLKGVIRSEDARALKDAKVIVFHEMSMVFVHRGISDRNGQYLFNLDPGPYRVWVVKRGFKPEHKRIMLLSHQQQVRLEHMLAPSELGAEQQSNNNLKKLLRDRNKNPYRSLNYGLLPAMNWEQDTSFAGTVRSHAVQDLKGGVGRRSTVEVATQINDQIRMESHVSNESRHDLDSDTMQILAGLQLGLRGVKLDIEAESIQDTGSALGASRSIRLSSDYDYNWSGASELGYLESQDDGFQQSRYHLSHDASYLLSNQAISHAFSTIGWEEDEDLLARHTNINTTWKHRMDSILGVRADVDFFELANENQNQTKLWLTGEHKGSDYISWSSRVGVHSNEEEHGLVQWHQIGASFSDVEIIAEYEEDVQFTPYDSQDVFGVYRPRPLTPYVSEGFYENANRDARLRINVSHNQSWGSELSLSEERNDAQLLKARRSGMMAYAVHSSRTYAYSLFSPRWGSRIEISHSENVGELAAFDRTGVYYAQNLSPFRKGPGIMLELQMTNHPDIPAWWLLNDMPWDPTDENTWYQGNLSVQF